MTGGPVNPGARRCPAHGGHAAATYGRWRAVPGVPSRPSRPHLDGNATPFKCSSTPSLLSPSLAPHTQNAGCYGRHERRRHELVSRPAASSSRRCSVQRVHLAHLHPSSTFPKIPEPIRAPRAPHVRARHDRSPWPTSFELTRRPPPALSLQDAARAALSTPLFTESLGPSSSPSALAPVPSCRSPWPGLEALVHHHRP